ncbi:hypothetical protein Taro_004229 [Colocasia esculenta]|uniref:RRM domain-containing protein n=1 Tax=Colocasia esculenta TaxID=4460 RepID=A0A843TU42_COLES|nr:hypothetical protein [Colocasia esculenta]
MALSATTATAPAAIHPSSSSSSSPSPAAVRFQVSVHVPSACRQSRWTPPPSALVSLHCGSRVGGGTKRSPLLLLAAVEGYQVVDEQQQDSADKEGEEAENGADDKRRKLYVVNIPWDFTAPEMRELFGQCGTVKDVEIIKQKNGKSRGLAFITMSSPEEARAVIEKFDSYELKERIIRVEFAKNLKKPSPRPAGASLETRNKIYVSNLAWKARSNNLREFFSENFKPVSARVVFDTPSGRAAGYGFVSFATKEEVDAAISELDGKELMGRPVRLKVSERKDNPPGSEVETTDSSDEQI